MMKTWSSSRSMSRTAPSARRASRCESRARRPIRRERGHYCRSPCTQFALLPRTGGARLAGRRRHHHQTPAAPAAPRGWRGRAAHRTERLGHIKPRASQAGLKAAEAYAGHGLRRGFLTSAARNRVTSRSTCCASTWTMPSASRITPSKGCCTGEGDSRSGRPRSAPILGQKCVR